MDVLTEAPLGLEVAGQLLEHALLVHPQRATVGHRHHLEAKIAKGLKYNEGMGLSNLLKVVLSPIYPKHEKSIIPEIKRAACEDAAVDKLTKGAVDYLIDEAWAASLDDPAFKALFDEARSACEACEIPSDDETDEADEAESNHEEDDEASEASEASEVEDDAAPASNPPAAKRRRK